MNLYEKERSFNHKDSLNMLLSVLEKNKISCVFEVESNINEVSHVALVDRKGKTLSAGSGKGVNHKIGAIAEALEHYITETSGRENHQKSTLSEVISRPEFKKDYLLHSLRGIEQNDIMTSFFYSSLHKDQVHVPTRYINPCIANTTEQSNNLDKILRKYSSNLGSGLGLTFHDSYIHGLNECIERHYVSLLFKEMISYSSGVNWVLFTDTKNTEYNKKQKQISNKFGEVLTVVTKTQFDTFVSVSFLVSEISSQFILTQIGSGSSMFPDLAIQRGIDELYQCLSLYDGGEQKEDYKAFKTLSKYSKLHPLIKITKESINKIVSRSCDGFNAKDIYKKQITIANTRTQVERIVNKLKKKGLYPLYRNLSKMENIYITQVFIPGLDRFHLIRTGSLVAPMSEHKKVVAL